jgi:glycine cleavage system regulatory protein
MLRDIMKMRLIKKTFITNNSIGKISKITKDIFNRGINIQKSQMVTNRNLLIFNTQYYNHTKIDMSDIVSKYNLKDLNQIFKQYTPPHKNYYYKTLTINCSDTPGIIHHTSEIMSNLDINIQGLESNSELSPISSIDVFNLKMTLHIPHKLKISDLEEHMETIVDKYGIEYILNKNQI